MANQRITVDDALRGDVQMLRLLAFMLLIGVASCDNTTGPDSPLVGQYELSSVNGDTTLAGENPDLSSRPFLGFVLLRNDGSYSYALIKDVCNSVPCKSPEVRIYGGTWSATRSNIELIENTDGTIRRWTYSSDELSGIESKFFNASANLRFRKCGTLETGGCVLTPGS
jgi:hypothetical protein